MSSLDTGGEGGTPCVGVECSHERCSNMTSMYKVNNPSYPCTTYMSNCTTYMCKVNNPTYINISITHIAQVVKTVTATKFRHEPFQDFYEVFEEIGR